MKNLPLLIKKNLRLLIRAKGSALIVIFAPLLIILLLGLSYNTSAHYGLNIGLYATDFSGDNQVLIDSLQNKDFKVVTYYELEDCKEDIKYNFVHACVELPDSFQVQDNSPKQITFHLDQSRINLVWIIQEALEEEFNLKTQELSESLIGNIFEKILSSQEEIESQLESLRSLQSSNDDVFSSSSSISQDLEGVGINKIESSIDQAVISEFQNFVSSRIDVGLTEIENARSKLLGLDNLSSEDVEEIEEALNSADESLKSAIALVAGTGDYSFEEIKSMISTLEEDVNLVNSEIGGASDKVSLIQGNTDSLVSSINTISSSLESVTQELENIKENLDHFDVSDSGTISNPLITKIEKITSEKTNLNYVFPSLLALIVMFLSIMLGETLVMMEKSSEAYIRNFLIPVKKITFIFATFLTNIILLSFQLLIILLIALLFIPDSISVFPLLFLVLIISAGVFTLVGMVIGYVFSSEETGVLASISTGSLFLFLSGVILPVEGMSVGLREITMFNPFVITEKLVREIFIFNSGLSGISEEILILLLYTAILFLFILVIDSVVSKNLLSRVLYKKHRYKRTKLSKNKKKNFGDQILKESKRGK